MLSKKRHFTYNLIATYGNTILAAFLSFVSVPVALTYWGDELYGVWTILTSFTTYIAASGLGIDTATGVLMTKNADIRVKIGILKKGVKLLVFASFVAAFIIVVLTIMIPDWFKIIGKMDELNYPVVKISSLIFIAGIIINLPLNAVSNSLQAFGKAYVGSMIATLQAILTFLSILVTVALGLSLPFYVLLVQSLGILCNLLKLLIVLETIKKEKRVCDINTCDYLDADDNHYKSILKTGINMSLYGLAFLFVPNISNLIISNNIDVKALVPYSLSYKLFSTLMLFVSNMNIALSPLLGSEFGKENWDWLIRTYKKMFYVSITFGAFLVLGCIWLSRTFIRLWTGSFYNYAGSAVSILLGIYFFIGVLSNINHVILNAFNYTSKVWLISWTDGILFLLSSLILIKRCGVIGVALGLSGAAFVVSSWAYPFIIYRRTEKRFRYDFKYLMRILFVFSASIVSFLFVSKLDLSFMVSAFFEITGVAVTAFILILILPGELRVVLLSKIRNMRLQMINDK